MFEVRLKVKKTLFLAAAFFLFSLIGLSQEESPHKPIVEKLEANWWQVPIFAVDHDSNPILDLKDADIEVWVNGKRLDTFTFYKRRESLDRSGRLFRIGNRSRSFTGEG